MANMRDYVYWRGDLTFSQSPFNEIDNVIFSELAYIDYGGVVPEFPQKKKVLYKNVVKKVFSLHEKSTIVLGLIVPNTIVKLMDDLHESKRFGSLHVSNYTNVIDIDTKTQFSAIVFHLSEKVIYVAYRGTDDTLIGWQENIDMLYTCPTCSQKMAVSYLEEIAKIYPNTSIYMGGHSKGGNLANYAAIYCSDEVKERIITCYTNDGQGMDKKLIDLEKLDKIKDKIVRIIPENDVIGMIFDDCSGRTIICKSNGSGVYQHDAFTWKIDVTNFHQVKEIKPSAVKMDNQLTKMIQNISMEDKIELGKEIYEFICASHLDTLMDCKKESLKLLKYINKFSGKSKKIFLQLFSEFLFFK